MFLQLFNSSKKPNLEGTIEISLIEEKILKITQSQKINSQLVYGLYPELIPDIEGMQHERDGSHSPVSSNEYAKNEGMSILGLNREQVETPNFGYHTISAIQNEMKISKVTLNNAFAKYAGLTNFQIQAMTDLGLNHNQVTSTNFGIHTIKGIGDIRKRRPELSSVEAFELIRGKSLVDTESFLSSFLSNTRRDQKPISEMQIIRVIVNPGRGFGHQRAAITLMQKLREMGFKGTFDILCDDGLGRMLTSEETLKPYINREPLVSGKLIGMISGFQASKLNSEQVSFVPELGAVKISSLPHDYLHNPDLRLSKVDLAVCAADDRNDSKAILNMRKFNSELYIGLQPTDWLQGRSFVIDQDGIATNLQPSSVTRLSSSAANNSKPHFVVVKKDTSKGSEESKEHRSTTTGLKMKKSGNVDEAIEMRRIVEANTLLSRKTGKPVIVLVPQKIALDNDFIKKVKEQDNNIHFVDLTQDNIDISQYKTGDVIVAYTGRLNQAFFDYLMLQGTTLPSVIEGCNSQELCESSGKSFIHGSGKFTNLKQYPVMLTAKQKLHTEASLCLEQGDPKYLVQLTQYMSESLQSSSQLTEYHQQRRENFLDRPDACELACDTLKVTYKKSHAISTKNSPPIT